MPAYYPLTDPEYEVYGGPPPPSLRLRSHNVYGGLVYRGAQLAAEHHGRYFYWDSGWFNVHSLEWRSSDGVVQVQAHTDHTTLNFHGRLVNGPFLDASGEMYVIARDSWNSSSVYKIVDDGAPATYRVLIEPVPSGGQVLAAGIDCGSPGTQHYYCSAPYPSGTIVSLAASPEAGYRFAFWAGDADCLDGVVTMTGDRQCSAIFERTVPSFPPPRAGVRRAGDVNGDGYADLVFYRPSTGQWLVTFSPPLGSQQHLATWGISTDIPVAADYDGDGAMDVAVFRPDEGLWLIRHSSRSGSYQFTRWGIWSDVPVPGDYDGDRMTDVAVFRPDEGLWIIRQSNGAARLVQWGISSDIPVPGDYDGDGRTDVAVFRALEGLWLIAFSSGNYQTYRFVRWGIWSDWAVPADYDGDGRTDIAIYRRDEGAWFINSGSTWWLVQWGIFSDIPMPRDFDGDGKADVAVFRRNEARCFALYSGIRDYLSQSCGGTSDIPVPTRPRGWWEQY